jgi:hypothetical protein
VKRVQALRWECDFVLLDLPTASPLPIPLDEGLSHLLDASKKSPERHSSAHFPISSSTAMLMASTPVLMVGSGIGKK